MGIQHYYHQNSELQYASIHQATHFHTAEDAQSVRVQVASFEDNLLGITSAVIAGGECLNNVGRNYLQS